MAAGLLLWIRRTTSRYATIWRVVLVGSALLCGLFLWQALSTPLYSNEVRGPANPGGFSVSVVEGASLFFLETCLVIPAFPVLLVAAALPPPEQSGKQRIGVLVACLLFVLILGGLIYWKHAAYVTDYQQTKQRQLN